MASYAAYTTTDLWHQWTSTGTTSATFATTNYPTNVWGHWVTTGTASTTITYHQQPIWEVWEEDEHDLEVLRRYNDEMQARREQRNREALAAAQQQALDRGVAQAAAMTLLFDVLTHEERVAFEESDNITVQGQDGRLYRIETHRDTVHGNIVRTDEHGCVLGRACVAPQMYGDGGALPTPDGWVGQYLGLKFDTTEFLSHANWSQTYGCRQRTLAA